jgi:PGF-pre-PGF domain-containing protein
MHGGITINKLIILLVSFLVLIGSGIGTAEIFVQPGDSIQSAVNNANATNSDNVIILKPGTYTENIKINANNLEIKSESGNPETTIISANNPNDNVIFLQQVNNVHISGLKITGAMGNNSGMYLSKCNNCLIDNNIFSDNGHGIYVLNSKGNKLSKNTAKYNREYGMELASSTGNTLSGNVASNNGRGVHFGNSDGNTLSGNTISSNTVYGLYVCPRSDNNVVFNNYFNNIVNAEIKNGTGNAYNTIKTAGMNIVGGPFIGGNYWAKPDGTGFSQTAVDGDGNGIADSAYQLENSIYADKLPLISASQSQQLLPVANFKTNTVKGPVPLLVQFTDLSQNAAKWSWDFDNEGNMDSTDQNPVHMYTDPGNYTTKLTVSNENGTNSKILEITVQNAQNGNNIYPVAEFSASVTGGYAPLSVLFTDRSQNAASRSWDINNDGIVDSTNESFVHVYTDPGIYTANLTVSNKYGIASKTVAIDVQAASSSGDGSSSSGSSGGSSRGSGSNSGGGGGGSPEPQSNVGTKELSQAFITSGKATKFDFPKNVTSIVYVSFDSKKTTGKTTTIVEMLKEKSTLVSDPPSDEIYKYLNTWVGNSGFATSENIENPVICFKVEKSWVQDKKIDQSSIALNRYSDKTWEQLQTSQSGEDDDYLYYTAKTPEYSFFAITGKVKTGETAVTDSKDPQSGLEIGNLSKEGNSSNSNPLGSDVAKAIGRRASAKSPGFETFYGIIFLIAAAFFFYKKR